MNWFKFYTTWGEGLQELSDTEAGRFIKALCACAESNEIQPLTGAEKVLFAIASKQLKQDAERSAKISGVRAEVGRIGGLSSKQTEANESKTSNCKQLQAKQAIGSNCSIKNKELRIKNSEEEERDIEREPKPIKHRHGNFQHVLLTDDDLARLQNDFADWQKRIQNLDDYLENHPNKHYANHNLTIRNWANKETEEKAKNNSAVSGQKKDRWDLAYEKLQAETADSNSIFGFLTNSEVIDI